jgi:alkylhydroperoxidase family enzyme
VLSVLDDYTKAEIPERLRALLAFVEKVNYTPHDIHQVDVNTLKAVGWSDEALYDAITVCSLFNFYNRWVDATGVQDMPPSAYEMTGKRLAEDGYDPRGGRGG